MRFDDGAVTLSQQLALAVGSGSRRCVMNKRLSYRVTRNVKSVWSKEKRVEVRAGGNSRCRMRKLRACAGNRRAESMEAYG